MEVIALIQTFQLQFNVQVVIMLQLVIWLLVCHAQKVLCALQPAQSPQFYVQTVHIVQQVKHFALGVKVALHALILDHLKEYSVLLLQDFFHIKVILTALNAQLERNVLSWLLHKDILKSVSL